MWLAQSLGPKSANAIETIDPANPLAPRSPILPAKAKRVIYLHMAGGPSQFELFDHKPELAKLDGQNCPDEFLAGKRFAFIRGVPQLLGPTFPLHQSGDAGHWISDRLPHHEKIIDKLCFIHTMQTEQFNHAPAQLMMHTGNQNFGYASLGSWVTYGLGSVNQNMPGFVVLLSGGKFPDAGKSVWGSGFLPGVYQGVQCRSQGEPVLFLSNPEGIDSSLRRQVIDAINKVNQQTYAELGDPETVTRIAQYEMAYRMQLAASDALDLKQETRETLEMYGAEPGAESLANNCLLARRLIERDVRFIQLFDWGWDAHGASASEALDSGFKKKCEEADKPIAALVTDLAPARVARRHAGDLGGRIRPHPHAGKPRRSEIEISRPRSSSLRLHHLARRRGSKARLQLRRDRRLRLLSGERCGANPRSSGHALAPVGTGSSEVDLSLPGFEPEVNRRQTGQRDPRHSRLDYQRAVPASFTAWQDCAADNTAAAS